MKKNVIAIGNGGCNIADDISAQVNVKEVSFVYCDLDENELAHHGSIKDLHITPNDIEKICEIVNVDRDDLILIVSCLGGKAGSTFAPRIAEKMATTGATVAAFVSKPMRLEGRRRLQLAQDAENNLRKYCKIVVAKSNETLSEQIALDSINHFLCRQATALLAMKQVDSRKIDTPEGVKKLMQSLWLSHKMGLPKPNNNIFWVDFEPGQQDAAVDIKVKDNRNSVKRLLDNVIFDDLAGFLRTSDPLKRNLIVLKDAFDFLRDQKLLEQETGLLKFQSNEDIDAEDFTVEHNTVSTPEEFVSLTVEVDDYVDTTPEMLAIKLLCLVTSDGKGSVYHYFKPDEKASEMFADYFREMRRQKSWFYKIFTGSKKKATDKAALNRLQDLAMARSLETHCVGDSWASNPFPCMEERWVVKEIYCYPMK